MNPLKSLASRGAETKFYNDLPTCLDSTTNSKNFMFMLDSKTISKSVRSLDQSCIPFTHSNRLETIVRDADYWSPSLLRISRKQKLIDVGCDYIPMTSFCLDVLNDVSIYVGGQVVHRLEGASLLVYIHLYESKMLDHYEKNLHIPIDILFKPGVSIASLNFHSTDVVCSYDELELDCLLNRSQILNFTTVQNYISNNLNLPKDVTLVIFEYLANVKSRALYYSIMKGVPLDMIKRSELGQEDIKVESIGKSHHLDIELRNALVINSLVQPFICTSIKEISVPLALEEKNDIIIQEFALPFQGLVTQFFYYVSATKYETNEVVLLDVIQESSLIADGITGRKLCRRDTLETDKLSHKIVVPTIPIHTITYANPNLFTTRQRFIEYSQVCVDLNRGDNVLKVKMTPVSRQMWHDPVIHIGVFWLNTLIYREGMGGVKRMVG
jgi:hypothetical protein